MNVKHLPGLVLVLSSYCHAAIVYPKEPDGGRQMVLQYANDFVVKNLSPFKGITTTNELTFAHALPLYSAGDLANGKLLAGARLGWDGRQSWKYVFLRETNVVGNAFLLVDEQTGKPVKCTGLGNDAFSEETIEALQTAGQWPQVQARDYEVRLLNEMLVAFNAVWLHGKTNDIIIPLPPSYNRFNAYQAYSESQVIKILEPEAKRDKAMWAKLDKQRHHDEGAYAKAMTDYEKAHGGKCGAISYYGMSAPIVTVAPHVQTFILMGMSGECGKLKYKVKVTYRNRFEDVKKVEILEKLAGK